MVLLFMELLQHLFGAKVPAAFTYSSTRMILAAMTTLLLTIYLGPRFIKKLYALKMGTSLREKECPPLALLHEKKKDTPTMGGILILFSMVVALFLWMDLSSAFTLILLITTLWLGIVGGIDDYLKLKHKNTKGLRPKKKLLAQLILGFFIALYLFVPSVTKSIQIGSWFAPPIAKEQVCQVNSEKRECKTHLLSTQEYSATYYVPFFKEPIFSLRGFYLLFAVLIVMFMLMASSNAVNLTDGLDGLAAGCVVMVALVLALFAFLSNHIDLARYLNILYIEGSSEIAVYLSATVGACLGFLWYNGYPAQVFMGDTGSLALGGILGVSSVLLRRELLFALIGGIFVAETVSVILQVGSYKYRHRKRIFLCAPLHHHFEYKGWPETKVVLRFWIIGLILALIGLVSLKLQ